MSMLSNVGVLAAESVGRTATLVRHAYGTATTIFAALLVAIIARDLVAYDSATGLSASEGFWTAAGTIGAMQIVSTVSSLVVAAVVLLAIVGGLQCLHLTRNQAAVHPPTAGLRSTVHAGIYWLGITVATVHALVWPWLECNAGGAFERSENGFSARPLVESWAFPLLAWVRVKVNWLVGLGVGFVVSTFFTKLWTFIRGTRRSGTTDDARPGKEPKATGDAAPTTPPGETAEPSPAPPPERLPPRITPDAADGRGPRRKRDVS